MTQKIDTLHILCNEEYAKLVHPLTEQEYQALKSSIQANGLWYPITVNEKGFILDGHHRFKVCEELNIEPKIETRSFSSEAEEIIFVIDSNDKRRHLNTFQRVELALKKKPIYEEIARRNQKLGTKNLSQKSDTGIGRVDEKLAKDAGTSRDTIRKVEIILEKADEDDISKTRLGKQKINQTYRHVEINEIRSELRKKASERNLDSIFLEISCGSKKGS